jgi:hypothetical protein
VVELIGSRPTNQPTVASDAAATPQTKTESAYDRFSRNFETWAPRIARCLY